MYECNFLFHLLSSQKLPQDAIPQKMKTRVLSNVRRSSRLSHPVWQLRHYLVDYKWWILLKPEQQSSSVYWRQWQGRRWEREHFRSFYVRRLPRRLRKKAAKEVCVHVAMCSCMCVCVCVCVCMCPCRAFRFLLVILAHFLLSSYMLYYVSVYSCNAWYHLITEILFYLQMEATY